MDLSEHYRPISFSPTPLFLSGARSRCLTIPNRKLGLALVWTLSRLLTAGAPERLLKVTTS
jgi:hypothetical protein